MFIKSMCLGDYGRAGPVTTHPPASGVECIRKLLVQEMAGARSAPERSGFAPETSWKQFTGLRWFVAAADRDRPRATHHIGMHSPPWGAGV